MCRLPNEGHPIIQAKRVDNGTTSSRRFANRSDIDAASAAKQIIRRIRTKAIRFDQ
jgi:hypothetical protein